MKKVFRLVVLLTLASIGLAGAQSTQSIAQPPRVNAQSVPPSAPVANLIGKVEVEPGQEMPFRLSFIDRKAFLEKRVTHPVPVTVRRDGTFEIPALKTLPEGYVLQSTPCVMPKAVMLAGVDILALHGKHGPSPFGASAWLANGGVTSLADMKAAMLDQVNAVRAGGVKWSACGGSDSGGAK